MHRYRRDWKRRAACACVFTSRFLTASTTTRCGGLVLVLVVAFTVLGVDPYLGVGSISDSLSCPPTHISIPGYLRHSVISRYRRFHTEIPVARKIVDGPPILPTNFVGAQCCCQLALGVKWERFLTRRLNRRNRRIPQIRRRRSRSLMIIYHFKFRLWPLAKTLKFGHPRCIILVVRFRCWRWRWLHSLYWLRRSAANSKVFTRQLSHAAQARPESCPALNGQQSPRDGRVTDGVLVRFWEEKCNSSGGRGV